MAAGLRVWGADGTLWVDTSARLSRGYGSANLGPGAQSVGVSMGGQGTPFTIVPNPNFESTTLSNGTQLNAPVIAPVSISATTISSSYSALPTGSYTNPYVFAYYGAF